MISSGDILKSLISWILDLDIQEKYDINNISGDCIILSRFTIVSIQKGGSGGGRKSPMDTN